jgi:3-hydroxy-3-methylglutaryl CoA synthase
MAVVMQGVYGGAKVVKYINETMEFWGMKPAKGVVLSGGIYPAAPRDEKIVEKDNNNLSKAMDGFMKMLNSNKPKKPSLFRTAIFHMTRSSMKYFDEALKPDKEYYEKMGWHTSDYYYPVYINPVKKVLGAFMDSMIKGMAKKSRQENI